MPTGERSAIDEADDRWGRPRVGDWIQTFTGRKFWPLDPRPEDVDVGDIAHALALQCRYTGHVREFYSVAEHSVRVAGLLRSQGHPPAVQLEGLLHDASEAYLSDIARPVKRSPGFEFYAEAEHRLQGIISGLFGVPFPMSGPVKVADGILLGTEARDLMAPVVDDWHLAYGPLIEAEIRPWSPGEAEWNFLATWRELSGPSTEAR